MTYMRALPQPMRVVGVWEDDELPAMAGSTALYP